jgi:hypothetical protein
MTGPLAVNWMLSVTALSHAVAPVGTSEYAKENVVVEFWFNVSVVGA